jgi:hypothetical protein
MAAASTIFGRIGAVSRRHTPTRPVGENTTNAMNVRPNHRSQLGVQIDRYSRNRM